MFLELLPYLAIVFLFAWANVLSLMLSDEIWSVIWKSIVFIISNGIAIILTGAILEFINVI